MKTKAKAMQRQDKGFAGPPEDRAVLDPMESRSGQAATSCAPVHRHAAAEDSRAPALRPKLKVQGLRYVAIVMVLFLVVQCQAATVTGYVHQITTAALETYVTFTPNEDVLVSGAGISGGPAKTILATNGNFSLTLDAGPYLVRLPRVGGRNAFTISVPNGAATYNVTNLIATPWTYEQFVATIPGFVSQAAGVGTNVALHGASKIYNAASNAFVGAQSGNIQIANTSGYTPFDFNGVTATYAGNGGPLTNLTAGNIAPGGTLPALDAGSLTNMHLFTNALVWYVDKNGNNATARQGEKEYPSLTISNASFRAGISNTIEVGSGEFHERVTLKEGQKLIGAGPYATRLTGSNLNVAILTVSNNNSISSMSIEALNTASNQYMFCINNAGWATNVTLKNVYIRGTSDGIFVQSDGLVHMRVLDSRLESDFDTVNISQPFVWDEFDPPGPQGYATNTLIELYNCHIRVAYNRSYAVPGVVRGVSTLAGNIKVYGGSITALNAPTNTSCAYVAQYLGTPGSIELSGVALTAVSTQGVISVFTNASTGVANLYGSIADRSKLHGSINIIGDTGRFWGTNAVSAGGGVTNTYGPIVIGANAAGAGAITLPNSGTAIFGTTTPFSITLANGKIQGSGWNMTSAGALTASGIATIGELGFVTLNDGALNWDGTATGNGSGITALNGTQVTTGTIAPARQGINASATLDFGSTAAGAVSDLTINSVTGAASGDVVELGIPAASVPANGTFMAWVSAANTVTVRFANNHLTTAMDPASGTFRVIVKEY